jgi:hypothetical protein
MMSQIDSWDRKISVGRHFQNGHHNTAQIQHCPISTTFHMWVDYDVNRTMLNFCGIVAAILKMATGRNFSMSGINSGHHNLPIYEMSLKSNNVSYVGRLWCPELIPDIEKFPHMKCRWNRTMWNLCGIVAAILKMATDRNFSILGINSGHHNLPTYEML